MYYHEDCNLPDGFKFPEEYLNLLSLKKFPDIYPWWFLAEEPDKALMIYKIINVDRYSSKLLVPFAKIDDETGDVACFDGEDYSGNPKIYFSTGTGSLKDIDWQERYFIPSFIKWFNSVKQ